MRNHSLPWLRLSAEFIVIVFGVLVALAADQWMEARDDRSTELEYVERLRANLAVDTLRFSQFADTPLAEKIRVLRELLQLRGDAPVVEDADALMAGPCRCFLTRPWCRLVRFDAMLGSSLRHPRAESLALSRCLAMGAQPGHGPQRSLHHDRPRDLHLSFHEGPFTEYF